MFKSMIYLFLSTQGAQVRIVNLTSAKGQEINGRVTKINGCMKNGRNKESSLPRIKTVPSLTIFNRKGILFLVLGCPLNLVPPPKFSIFSS